MRINALPIKNITQCALRRQLDGFAQDTPIGEIVDSCRVWESHSDSNRVSTVNCDSDVGNQPSDSRTRERRKVVVDTERQEPRVGNREDGSRLGVLVDRWYQSKLEETRRRDRPPTGGPGMFFLWRRWSQGQPMPASERGIPSFTGGLVVES